MLLSNFCKNNRIVGHGEVCPKDFHPQGRNVNLEDGTIEVYPIDNNGVEKKWVLK